MPQVAEKIDERILKILGLKDTFDLDYSDYSSLLKERMVLISMGKSGLSREEEMLIRDEFKRVRGKSGKFKGTKKKISVDSLKTETKKPKTSYYKSPFEKGQEVRKKVVIPNNKVTAISTFVEKQEERKNNALATKGSDSIFKPLQDYSNKITKISNILESTQKQEKKIEDEKKKDSLKEKDEQKKRDIESKIEKKIELPNLIKLADPLLKPVKGIFQRILEAFGWLATGWLVDKAIVWMSNPANQQKIDDVKNWFDETGKKLESPESVKRFGIITKFLREHWLALFGSTGLMLLWSNGLVRFTVKLGKSIGTAVAKIGFAVGKMLANLAIRNPAAAAAFAAATAGLYLANKEKVDKAALPYLKGAKDFAEGAVDLGKTAVQKGSEFVDAGDKLFKVGKYSEDYGKNVGGVIGLNSGGTVPVMLTRGEVVIPPNKARQIGYNNLYAMNSLGNHRNLGGPILPFNTGGGVKVVPGRGPNVDSVRDRLPVGSFVLQRPAVDAMGGPKAFRGYNQGGAVNTIAQYGTPSQRALLDTISFAEGTYTKNREEGYKIMFTGKRFDTPPWRHPRKLNSSGRYKSDAAGRYQFLSTTWDGLKLPDFSPNNQDKGALKLVEGRYTNAWRDLESKGLTNDFMNRISGIWASFPTLSGASAYGQPVKKADKLRKKYDEILAGAGAGVGADSSTNRGTNTTGEPEGGVSSASSPLDFFSLMFQALDRIEGKVPPPTTQPGDASSGSTSPDTSSSPAKPPGIGRKVFLHWTAGNYNTAFPAYHSTILGDGSISKNTPYNKDKDSHTAGANRNSVGISVAAAGGATEKKMGSYPPKPIQLETMAKEVAGMAKSWGWSESTVDSNVKTHGEWERYAVPAGILKPPVQRWDLDKLKDSDKFGTGGPTIRNMIKQKMKGKNEGGVVQGFNKGGLVLLTSGGGTNPLKTPVRWGDLRPHHGTGDKVRKYGITKDFILDGPGYPAIPVPTPVDSVVKFAGDKGDGYGNSVELLSPNGKNLALLGHFSKLNVNSGDKLSAGQILGLQGSTGRSTGPHVHIDAQKEFHTAWANYVLGNKDTLSAETLAGSSNVKPGEDTTSQTSSDTPLNFFSLMYKALDTIEGKTSTTTSPTDTKLKQDINKIATTPPSKSKPQSTVSTDMMSLPPDVMQGKKEERKKEPIVSKPNQHTLVVSVPSADMATITPSPGGFQWSYAEYFGIK